LHEGGFSGFAPDGAKRVLRKIKLICPSGKSRRRNRLHLLSLANPFWTALIGSVAMTGSRELATAVFAAIAVAAMAVLVCVGTKADAAQCGSGPAGFEAWKSEFAGEARAKGIGTSSIAGLMQANYATATIAADRGQRSFGLSLDQFLAKAPRPLSRAAVRSSSRRRRCSHRSSSATASRRDR
jgi:hypothetical protein